MLIAAGPLLSEMLPDRTPAPESYSPRNYFTLGIGIGLPRQDLSPTYQPAANATLAYGYRPVRFLQLDAGFETLFGSARVRDFVDTNFGSLRVRDFQYLVPLGGRVIAPLPGGKWELYAGGGGAYLNYREQIQQPFQGVRFACPSCARRGGWGYYAQAGVDHHVNRLFRIGGQFRVYRGRTEGDPLGGVPFRTNDQWNQLTITLGLRF
jgi:hypothetical protein